MTDLCCFTTDGVDCVFTGPAPADQEASGSAMAQMSPIYVGVAIVETIENNPTTATTTSLDPIINSEVADDDLETNEEPEREISDLEHANEDTTNSMTRPDQNEERQPDA